ncbi:ABC transporter ATP-binding protein [Helicobacter didelphidarum]|uniref:ABC transporter ATP-binding protein n=1 Tax=Helicobacter didelphidarum TaxID=2040648 RepID=A0A3D8IG07_9HELI|nr:ABC transporter ATP-binding protein [Helicobacter didelphidarum]
MILKVDSLSKNYDLIQALDNVSFQVKSGEVFGLLGRNGGGKTTLIKILTSMILEYSGRVWFLGYPLNERKHTIFFKQNIAYLPDKDFLYPHMTPTQSIRFFTDFFTDFSTQKAQEIMKKLDIPQNQKIGTMSKGQAEKVGIALILARNARLYLFDEPLAGADVISRDEIFKIIQEYCCNGATIIATHLVSSVEPILDSALFLNKKSMAYASKKDLLHGFSNLEDSFRYYAADSIIKPLKQSDVEVENQMQ